MNPRLAVTAVFALVVIFVFIAYLLERKRAVRRREMAALRDRVVGLELLVDDIQALAVQGSELDVSAERIVLRIRRYQEEQQRLKEVE